MRRSPLYAILVAAVSFGIASAADNQTSPSAPPRTDTAAGNPAAPTAAAPPTTSAAETKATPPAGAAPTAGETPTKTPAARPSKAAAGGKKPVAPEYKGPTETDIRVAYTDKINAINAGTTQYLDAAAAAKVFIRVVKVNFVECATVSDSTKLYICSALIESAVGEAAAEFKRVEIAMIKEKDAWRVK